MLFGRKKIDDNEWDALNREVIGLTTARNTVLALPKCRELISLSKKHYGKKHRNTMVALSNMGMIYFMREDTDQAESFFLQALEICEKLYGKFSKDYSSITTNLSQVYKYRATEADRAVAAVTYYDEKHKVVAP